MSRKKSIYKASVKLIAEKGINHFSINNVCEEAEISKGGFIYYFPNKEKLLEGINEYIRDFSIELIEKELDHSSSYTEAYVKGCLNGYQTKEKTAYSALISYYSEQDMEDIWASFYEEVEQKLLKETTEEVAQLVLLTTDGLWLRGTNGYPYEKVKKSLNLLLNSIEQERLAP